MLTAVQENTLSPKNSQESLKSQNEILKKIKLVKNSQEIIQKLKQCQNLQSCGSQKKIVKFTDFKNTLKFLEIWEEMDGNLSNFLDFERVYSRFKENLENEKEVSTKDVSCRKESLHYLYAKELEFLKNQRTSSLKRGAWFQDLQENSSVFRLSEDEQYLYFQEYSTKAISKQEIPSIDELHSFVKVEDITLISLEKTGITGKSYSFSISGFDHEIMQEEFQVFFLTNSSTQFVEWYEGLCLLTGKSIFSLEIDLPFNGKDVVSILNDVESCIDSKPVLKPQINHGKADLPNFDFFYTNI